ncbi:GGDEF domain-containing protein [Mangrovihabitans endophyticus]|uniref:GGDEF domain-containing protein n=1 Tax=Mangrovihabitans endophyticus TaxID=1751298 RepID=UPI001E46FD4A|nr:GGDEF domain-containing protein [Mangrovihabitans endophyticus]
MTSRLPVPVDPYGVFTDLGRGVHDRTMNGHHREALRLADEAEAVAAILGDRQVAMVARQGRMYALLALGRLNEALVIAHELAERRQGTGPRASAAKAQADLAELLIRLGRVDEGLHWLARATAALETTPRGSLRYFSALCSVGDAAQAADLYELADDCARQAADALAVDDLFRSAGQLQHAEMLLEWGLRLEQVGRADEAWLRLNRSVAILTAYRQRHPDTPLGAALLALGLARTGRAREALELVDRSLLPLREAGQIHEARLLHLAHGSALRHLGDLAGAHREFVAAEQLAEQTGQRLIIHHELATLAAARTPGEATTTMLAALQQQVSHLWRQRLDRRLMLQQARRRAELELAREMAEGVAASDALTGLGNRRTFDQRLGALRHGTALILVDVDRFKTINDTYSHGVGDGVLTAVAEILSSHCRRGETAVRFGGDEFALFLHADLTAATVIAQRIRRVVVRWNWNDLAPGLRVTLSMGAAVYTEGMTGADLFDRADHQLYAAKRQGRDRLVA